MTEERPKIHYNLLDRAVKKAIYSINCNDKIIGFEVLEITTGNMRELTKRIAVYFLDMKKAFPNLRSDIDVQCLTPHSWFCKKLSDANKLYDSLPAK